MNLNRRLGNGGDTMVYRRETTPASFVEERDASGTVLSVKQAAPAIIYEAEVRQLPFEEGAAAGGLPVLPILLAVGAAWMLVKG
jgi:hypothetical protein